MRSKQNAIYEYILKSKFIEFIIEKVKLKNSIDETGVEDIILNCDDVPFREYIKNTSKEITIVHAYGSNWTINNLEAIKETCFKKKINITVLLLSTESPFCNSIEKHYGKKEGNMAASIKKIQVIGKR